MKILILFLFLISNSLVNCQIEKYEKNTWFSFVWRHTFNNNVQLTSDIGYRMYDNFLGARRQDLIRVLLERSYDRNQFGLGLAYFETVKRGTNIFEPEKRFFFNYNYQKSINGLLYNLRIRDELRYYSTKSQLDNRIRLMLSVDYDNEIKWFRPRISCEGFLTTTQKNNFEQRYTVGNQFYINTLFRLYLFYTLQLQSKLTDENRFVNQNIIGFQLILNTFNKNENKSK
jgi:hypothetical protein